MDRLFFKQKTFEAIKADSPSDLQDAIRALDYPVDIEAILQVGARVVAYVTQKEVTTEPEPFRGRGKSVKKPLKTEDGDI